MAVEVDVSVGFVEFWRGGLGEVEVIRMWLCGGRSEVVWW